MGFDGNTDRIRGDMTMLQAMVALSEGNPGAVRVLMEAYRLADDIDPDNVFGGFGALLTFDSYRIYGSKIWMLYKDLCNMNINKTLGMLRAMQLGFVDSGLVHTAMGDDRTMGNPAVLEKVGGVDGLMAKVKERLPAFQIDVVS